MRNLYRWISLLGFVMVTGRSVAALPVPAYPPVPLYRDSIVVDSVRIRLDSVLAGYRLFSRSGQSLYSLRMSDSVDISGLVSRLYNFACWQVFVGRSVEKSMRELADRERFFCGIDSAVKIAPSSLPIAGDTASSIRITVYVGGACPLCKRTCIPLHDSVTTGGLRGIASLTLKPAGRDDADAALIAAAALGDFWLYYGAFADVHTEIDEKVFLQVAEETGFNVREFKKRYDTDSLRTIVWDSRREAINNGLEYTPFILINNRPYSSSSHPQWITEAVVWEWHRLYDHLLRP